MEEVGKIDRNVDVLKFSGRGGNVEGKVSVNGSVGFSDCAGGIEGIDVGEECGIVPAICIGVEVVLESRTADGGVCVLLFP